MRRREFIAVVGHFAALQRFGRYRGIADLVNGLPAP